MRSQIILSSKNKKPPPRRRLLSTERQFVPFTLSITLQEDCTLFSFQNVKLLSPNIFAFLVPFAQNFNYVMNVAKLARKSSICPKIIFIIIYKDCTIHSTAFEDLIETTSGVLKMRVWVFAAGQTWEKWWRFVAANNNLKKLCNCLIVWYKTCTDIRLHGYLCKKKFKTVIFKTWHEIGCLAQCYANSTLVSTLSTGF